MNRYETIPLPRDLDARAELVQAASAAVPADERLLLQLHYFEGVGCETLACMFGTTTGAIHVRLCRARKRFRLEFLRLALKATSPDTASPAVEFDVHQRNSAPCRTDYAHSDACSIVD